MEHIAAGEQLVVIAPEFEFADQVECGNPMPMFLTQQQLGFELELAGGDRGFEIESRVSRDHSRL